MIMKLIIDISKEKYEWIKNNNPNADTNSIVGVVANGIPYEERPQGDLISRSELKKEISNLTGYIGSGMSPTMLVRNKILDLINNASTVIIDNCGKCPYYKDSDRDIITEAYNDGYKTAKEDFENHKLVNSSQELVKDLVKEKSERPQGDLISREALKEAIRKRLCISSLKYLTEQEKVIVEEIDNAPSIGENQNEQI